MKAATLTLLGLGLGTVGAAKVAASETPDAPAGASVSASVPSNGAGSRCWSDAKIKNDRFSFRGAEGAIRSFELEKVAGCTFRVKIVYTTRDGSERTLDYDATFARGSAPIFVRYHSPP